MICDYYWVRKGYLQIKDLYSGKKTGPYYFTFGFNWRGYAAYIAGVLINIVGFVGAIGKEVPIGARRIYDLNFFAGFLVSSISYWALCRISPIPATSDTWMEVGDEITDISVAYHDSDNERYDEEAMHGGSAKGIQEPKADAMHSKNY
jgi:NCS1 family nucleobase:cation symporter-1